MIRTLSCTLALALLGALIYPAGYALADEESKPAIKTPEANEPEAKKPEETKSEAKDSSKEKQAEATKDDDSKENEEEKDDAKEASDKKDKADKDAKKDEKKERKTAKVEEKRLKVQVTVDGVFVAREMTPVALRPEEWSKFKIEEIVPHGATVRQGERLVKFDAKDLNESIDSLELSQRISELALRKAEEELPRMEKTLEMSLTDAEQSNERIQDDYKRYKEVDRDRYIKSLKMSLKMSKQSLDYAKDELEQLEKMYEADDLTEETEEIILTRTRQQVEQAEYFYERAKIRHDEALEIYLPRNDEDNEEVVERVEMSLQRAKLASQIDLNRARYELEQLRVSREKSLERHAKLLQDRGLMELKSPAAGVVYYGQCVNGKWGDMSSMIGKLKPHASVSSGTVMMTIVETKPMYLLATVGEKERPTVEEGQPASIRPTGEGAEAIEGSVASVSTIPISSGKFELQVDLSDDTPDWLVPGMSGKIKVTTYNKKDALVLNKEAVHSEEDDEDEKYVWLVKGEDEDQEVEKQRVKVGKSKDDLVEILDGLDEGDVVSLEDEKKRKEEEEQDDDDDDDDD